MNRTWFIIAEVSSLEGMNSFAKNDKIKTELGKKKWQTRGVINGHRKNQRGIQERKALLPGNIKKVQGQFN